MQPVFEGFNYNHESNKSNTKSSPYGDLTTPVPVTVGKLKSDNSSSSLERDTDS